MTKRTLAERLRDVEGSLSWCEHHHQRAASTPAQWANHVKVLWGDIDTVREAAAALERLEALDRERAEWVEAWDMMRDTILDDYGPLEIDEILTTIDYHDPRSTTPAPAPQQGGEG